jgi:hypothetical protein
MLAQGMSGSATGSPASGCTAAPWACLWATNVLRFSSERPTTRETDDARA